MDSIQNQAAADDRRDDYGQEVLCASWNPQVAALAEPALEVGRERVDDGAALDAETFLTRFYRSQQG